MKMGKIKCDKCGATTTALDSGFDPAVLGMTCPCGGNWKHTILDHSDDDRLPWTDGGHSLQLHSVNGGPVVEFRIEAGKAQRRMTYSDPNSFPSSFSAWANVSERYIADAISMDSPFGQWIKVRR